MAFRFLLSLVFALTAVVPLQAQTMRADRFTLTTGPCSLHSGSGTPEGAQTAPVCDLFLRSDTGDVYRKASGSGDTGWSLIALPSGDVAGTVLAGTASDPAWSATPSLTSLSVSGTDGLEAASSYVSNIGSINDKFLSVHAAELWVSSLVAQETIATIGGRIVVAPTTQLTSGLSNSATSISVKHNQIANGDRLLLESNGQVEFLAVTSGASGSGPYTYTVTRNLDGSGANTWAAGDALVNTGTTGDGFIDLYSVRGVIPGSTVGPTIVGNVRTGTGYSNLAPRWAIGNLNGLYGYSADTYGAAFGDPSNAWVKIDAANGVRLGHGGTAQVAITAAGDASFTGTVTATAGNVINALAAGSITTNKLAIGFGGAALNDDAGTADASAWTAGTIATVSDGKVGNTTLRSGTTTTSPRASRRIPIDAAKTYRVHFWARKNGAANGVLYLGVSLFDSAGSELDQNGNAPGDGSLWYYGAASGIAGSTSWTEYTATFGANGTKTIPAGARTMSPLALLNLGGSAGYFEIQDVRIEEILPGTLIQDGVITTGKLAADSVTSAKIAAGTIVAGDIAAGTITATELAADSVTSAKIAAGTITASDIAAGTITADKLNVTTLSAINANLGSVTAGEMMFGSSNRIWLNDAADGTIRVGGSTKGSAPFRVNADGELHSSYGNFNTLVVDTNIALSFTTTGAGNRFLCVNSTGGVFDSAVPCN